MLQSAVLAAPKANEDKSAGPVMPLALLGDSETGHVQSLRAAGEQKRHLECLGFVQGAPVRVVSRMGDNPIVEVKGARVALSRSLAAKIMVSL